MSASVELGHQLGIWSIIPFALMLLCVAMLPLLIPHWYESNRNKGIVAAVLAIPVLI